MTKKGKRKSTNQPEALKPAQHPSRWKKMLGWGSALVGIIALIAALISNIEKIVQAKNKVFSSPKDDLVIIDNYVNEDTILQNTFKKDTLEFRLLNTGEKTIVLREAHFIVDSIWKLDRISCSMGMDMASALYGVILPDSSFPYQVKVRLKQSIKPDESDMFGFLLNGGTPLKSKGVYENKKGELTNNGYSKSAYFIRFKVRFFINNSEEFIETKSLIHFFGSGFTSEYDLYHGCYGLADSAIARKEVARNVYIAKGINSQLCYKSPAAINEIKDLLRTDFSDINW